MMDPASTYSRLSFLEYWLERSVHVPVLRRRMGLDSLLGLLPVAGDLIAGTLGAYIVFEGWRLGMPSASVFTMARRLAVDTGVGAIPVLGDLWDMLYASNSRNLNDVKRFLEAQGHGTKLKSHPVSAQPVRRFV